jgi:putative endonuclease
LRIPDVAPRRAPRSAASLRFEAPRKSKAATPQRSEGGLDFELFYSRSKGYGLAGWRMKNFFYVYILIGKADGKNHYTGFTRDLQARLMKHNQAGCADTSRFRPWQIETAIAFRSEKKARAFEKYLKTGSGREFARRHF